MPSLSRLALVALLLLLAVPAAREIGQALNSAANRQDAPYPDRAQVEAAWDLAMGWVQSRQEELLASENYYLWEYLFMAADMTGDPRLEKVVADYRARHLENERQLTMTYLFLGDSADVAGQYPLQTFRSLKDYDKAMVYSRACREEMKQDEVLVGMHHADYCNSEILKNIHSSCINHQMKGISFIQSTGCPPAVETDLNLLMTNLQGQTHSLLQTDAQVSDIYVQRILLLHYTGAPELVRPVWLQRVLEHQQPDGGWLPYQKVLPVFPGADIGFGWQGLSLHRSGTTFHTSSIAILVLAYMLQVTEEPET